MATIAIEIPDELAARADELRERLPALLALSLEPPALPTATYRSILDFLATNPSAAEIMAFGPTAQMQERLRALLERSQADTRTPSEEQELDAYERIEHLMILIKTGSLPYLRRAA